MIEAFTGMPGCGKTYLMTKRALKLMKKGHRVFANFPLKGAIPYTKMEELFVIKRIKGEKIPIVLLDEAGLIAPAGAWKAIPFEVMAHWRQHRHAGIDIWYTAQNLKDIAVPLRRVTQYENQITKFGPFITYRCIETSSKQKYGSGFTILSSEVYKNYDTFAENVERQDYLKNV
ncbi:MAG: zonular occludens toxin domain-containing protein [Gorillibacterium sp.]|nr:zonular occludens toxin domain-containing protein [Gorillibacterium sp.]